MNTVLYHVDDNPVTVATLLFGISLNVITWGLIYVVWRYVLPRIPEWLDKHPRVDKAIERMVVGVFYIFYYLLCAVIIAGQLG